MVNKGNHRINSDSETIFQRFRNQISAIPQPKTYTLPQPKKAASATKKRRFRNQKKMIPQPKKDDSETKNPIPQPKKDNSATTIHAIPKPKSASHLRPHSTWILSRCGGVGLGGVGWGWDNDVLAAAFPRRHTCCHTQHGIVSRCGWGGTITSWRCVPSFDTLAATLNMASSPDAGGWGWVGWGGVGQ